MSLRLGRSPGVIGLVIAFLLTKEAVSSVFSVAPAPKQVWVRFAPKVGSQLLSLPFNLPVLAAVLPLPSVWSRFGFGRRWRIRPGGAHGGGLGAGTGGGGSLRSPRGRNRRRA